MIAKKRLFIRYDFCEAAVVNMRKQLLRMNRVRPVLGAYRGWAWCDEQPAYEKMRLALAKRVCGARPEVFANDREKCQTVLDTIDALFQARG